MTQKEANHHQKEMKKLTITYTRMTFEQKRIRELEYLLLEAEKIINYQMGIMTQTHGPTHKMTEGLRAMAWKLSDMRTKGTMPDCPSCEGEGFIEGPEFEVNACERCGGSGELKTDYILPIQSHKPKCTCGQPASAWPNAVFTDSSLPNASGQE